VKDPKRGHSYPIRDNDIPDWATFFNAEIPSSFKRLQICYEVFLEDLFMRESVIN
jgi:hypothetical protein